jgi:hydrogenase nickel incorporation protein HypA/HybF
MHELSIANSLVEIASEHARAAGASRLTALTVRIGTLSCVHRSALEFSFQLVTEGTLLEGAELKIVEVPATIYCQVCEEEVMLSGIQRFRCPRCDTPSADIRQGRELDLESIECVESSEVVSSEE